MFRLTALVAVITFSLTAFAVALPSSKDSASLAKRGNTNDGSRTYRIGPGIAGVPVAQNSLIKIGDQVWDTRHTTLQQEGQEASDDGEEQYQDVTVEFHHEEGENDEKEETIEEQKGPIRQLRPFHRHVKPLGLKYSSTGRRIIQDQAGKAASFRKEENASGASSFSSSTHGGSSSTKDKKAEVALLDCDPHAFI